MWGKKGDITEFHLENEYEILAICFRTEVESFLVAFDRHYNFSTEMPRNVDLIVNVPPRDVPPHFLIAAPVTPTSRTLHDETISEPKCSLATERIGMHLETGGPQGRRQSNLYNFGNNELGDHLHKSHPEGTPHWTLHTNKLREVLGDSDLPIGEPTIPTNHLLTHNVETKSDDLERDSSSTRIFQNRNQRDIPQNNGASDFEVEREDHRELRDHSK